MKINKTKIMKYAKKTQTFFDSSVISLPHTSFESEENVLCRTESDVKTNKNWENLKLKPNQKSIKP